jgi:hypothetical protein
LARVIAYLSVREQAADLANRELAGWTNDAAANMTVAANFISNYQNVGDAP